MNRVHRTVWNAALEVWQAVTETALNRSRGGRAARSALSVSCALAAVSGSPGLAQGLPTGGSVTAGQGAIFSSGPAMTVTQATDRLAIDWRSFSIGTQNRVHFAQPSTSSVVLNRVLGADASTIQGTLTANGQVFLVNPNGVLFAPGSQVSVGGLVATTLDLGTSQFMAGQYRFSGTSSRKITNQGVIDAPVTDRRGRNPRFWGFLTYKF
jgi:filamentous hemagglutinin family protein